MAKTHYETLGVDRVATAAQIRSAYRKIALVHHPDRSKDPRSTALFVAATEAYETLSDDDARSRYDEILDRQAQRQAERQFHAEREREAVRQRTAAAAAAASAAQAAASAGTPGRGSTHARGAATTARRNLSEDLIRLTGLYTRGNHMEAERLAREIAQAAPTHATPYAVLGDIARLRGDVNEAAKMYAYAVQFEPGNPTYQRRYDKLLSGSKTVVDKRQTTTLAHKDRNVLAPMAALVAVGIGAITSALVRSMPMAPRLEPISTWSWTMAIVLFLGGVAIGACFSAGNLLDALQDESISASGRLGPAVALAFVALVNFWAAALLYGLLGLFQRAWSFSMTRLLGGVASAVLIFTLAAAVSRSHVSAGQTLLWGGNLTYLGSLLGWLVADSFRV